MIFERHAAAAAFGAVAGYVESLPDLEAQPGDPADWLVPISAVVSGAAAHADPRNQAALGVFHASLALLGGHLGYYATHRS